MRSVEEAVTVECCAHQSHREPCYDSRHIVPLPYTITTSNPSPASVLLHDANLAAVLTLHKRRKLYTRVASMDGWHDIDRCYCTDLGHISILRRNTLLKLENGLELCNMEMRDEH